MKIENLLKTKVTWKRHPTSMRFFYHEHDKQLFLLRINNFPDEILYTVISGLEINDLEDKPVIWELER